MKKSTSIALIVIAVLALFFLSIFSWGISHYNKLVTMKENIDGAWAQVDNQLSA